MILNRGVVPPLHGRFNEELSQALAVFMLVIEKDQTKQDDGDQERDGRDQQFTSHAGKLCCR